jgi:hypothetical protein
MRGVCSRGQQVQLINQFLFIPRILKGTFIVKIFSNSVCFLMVLTASIASAQTTVFNHDFTDATPGDLSAAGTLGTPTVGTIEATGGFVSATRPAYTTGNNLAFNGITVDAAGSFNDVGTPSGNFLTVNLSEPAAATSLLGTGQTTTVNFSLASFGINNPTIFKYMHIIGRSSAGAEVFHIVWRAGSNGGAREVYARELGQDSTNFVAVDPPVLRDGNLLDFDFESVDGTLIAAAIGFGINSTNTASAPSGQVAVSITIDENGWGASATPTGGSVTETPATGLGIASGATDLASIIFFSSHNDLNLGNVGFWVDNVVVATDLTVDGDGAVDCLDVDEYIGILGMPATGGLVDFDLETDGTIDSADVAFLVENLVQTTNGQTGTFLGDLNCDGQVNVLGDAFILVANLGSSATSYLQGDINLDGTINVLGDAFALVANLGSSNN